MTGPTQSLTGTPARPGALKPIFYLWFKDLAPCLSTIGCGGAFRIWVLPAKLCLEVQAIEPHCVLQVLPLHHGYGTSQTPSQSQELAAALRL